MQEGSEWEFLEILELLRNVNSFGYDFSQIANKLKDKNESHLRPKGFYTPQLCETVLKNLLEATKKSPTFSKLFDAVGCYSERFHIRELLKQYEHYHKQAVALCETVLLSTKFKTLANRTDLYDDINLKLHDIYNNLPSLLNIAVTSEEYEKNIERQDIVEELLRDKNKKMDLKELLSVLTERQEMNELKKSLAENQFHINPITYLPTVAESSSLPDTPASSPVTTGSVKRIRPSGTSQVDDDSKVYNIDETPTIRKKTKKGKDALKTPKLSKGATPPSAEIPKSSSKKKVVPQHKIEKRVDSNTVSCQTYLSLLPEYPPGLPPPIVLHENNPMIAAVNEPTRTVKTQTGKIQFVCVGIPLVKWVDDSNSIQTLKMAAGSIRSYSPVPGKGTVQIGFNIRTKLVPDPFNLALQDHPCHKLLHQLRKHDKKIGLYFHFPPKFEIARYPSWIKRPMDILTMEDLMISKHIENILDFSLFTRLIVLNAVVYGQISDDAKSFLKDAMNDVETRRRAGEAGKGKK